MSAQSCFLPISTEGGETPFNVQIYNYQSRQGDPAVLAIVASANGTSSQILQGEQKLYFNQNGNKCSFIGKRLSQYRIEKGKINLGQPMDEEEKEQNFLLIIQVPLKQKNLNHYGGFTYGGDELEFELNDLDSMMPGSFGQTFQSSLQENRSVDVEHAIIEIGQSEGIFDEIQNLDIERDTQYPVRVTLQYYKATSNGAINSEVIGEIYQQLVDARQFGENVGSLVVGGNTNRPTESTIKYGGLNVPIWWNDFWLTYSNVFVMTEVEARDKVFKNGRFCTAKLNEVKERILDILGTDENVPPTPKTGIFTLD